MSETRRATAPRLFSRSSTRPSLRIVETDRPAGSTRAASTASMAPASVRRPAWVRQYRARLRVNDTVVVALAVALSFVARRWLGESFAVIDDVARSSALVAAVVGVIWLVALEVYRTRDPRIIGVGVAEYRRIASATLTTFGLIAIVAVAVKIDVSRGFFALALPIGLIALTLSRWAWRQWLVWQRGEGNYLSRAIVVGDESDVRYVIGQIDKKGIAAYKIVGASMDAGTRTAMQVNQREVPIVSDLGSVAAIAQALSVDTVIVAGQPADGGQFIRDLGWDLEGTTAELVVASQLTNVAGPRIHFRPVDGLPLMHVELPQYEGAKHAMKRAFDVAASGAALVFLAPLMLIIAWMVRKDSEGPVLFRQERVGRGGQTFSMVKFRSMVTTAETDLAGLLDKNEGAGVLFKMKNDPRITRIGAVLRKYSLDELPQLWNIFVGDMSIVGPRPPLPSEVAEYEHRVHRRLYIKPGLTGMWQVNGRSNLGWDESVRLDLFYVENWSLAGDLVIMWRTLRVLRNAQGAY